MSYFSITESNFVTKHEPWPSVFVVSKNSNFGKNNVEKRTLILQCRIQKFERLILITHLLSIQHQSADKHIKDLLFLFSCTFIYFFIFKLYFTYQYIISIA